MPDMAMKSLSLDCSRPLKVGFGGTGAPAFFRAASKKLTCFASSSMISRNALSIVSEVTVETVRPADAGFMVAIDVLLFRGNGCAASVHVRGQRRCIVRAA